MIQKYSRLKVADNSGAKTVMCINVLGIGQNKSAQLGEIVIVSVKNTISRPQVKKKEIHRGVVVRQSKPFRRKDGSSIRFDDNAVILINPDKTPKGTRVFGPVAREIRDKGFNKIISQAKEVL